MDQKEEGDQYRSRYSKDYDRKIQEQYPAVAQDKNYQKDYLLHRNGGRGALSADKYQSKSSETYKRGQASNQNSNSRDRRHQPNDELPGRKGYSGQYQTVETNNVQGRLEKLKGASHLTPGE